MDRVDNGGSHELLIEGVHSGRAGSEAGPDGALIVAFRPNIGRLRGAGGTATLDGAAYRIAAAPAPVSAGFVRVELRPL